MREAQLSQTADPAAAQREEREMRESMERVRADRLLGVPRVEAPVAAVRGYFNPQGYTKRQV